MSVTGRALLVSAVAATGAPDRRSATTNGLGHKSVVDIQRARILAAMVQAACEHGGGNVTVARVVARAGISRRTFYEIFDDREDCLLAALDEAFERIARRVVPAYEAPLRWREKIRAALTALLELFDKEPDLGRFVVVETFGYGTRALQRRRLVLTTVMAAVQEGGAEARSDAIGPLTAEAVVGAVCAVIHDRVLLSERRPLVELVNPLMSTIVLPYLGPAAARRELRQPVPIGTAPPPKRPENPFKELDIRLTYRTVRALLAVAERPSSSNRAIADASGIADQGQVSKLLTRLERLGLVENAGGGAHRGEPNAWMLTPAGEEIRDVVATQAPIL